MRELRQASISIFENTQTNKFFLSNLFVWLPQNLKLMLGVALCIIYSYLLPTPIYCQYVYHYVFSFISHFHYQRSNCLLLIIV